MTIPSTTPSSSSAPTSGTEDPASGGSNLSRLADLMQQQNAEIEQTFGSLRPSKHDSNRPRSTMGWLKRELGLKDSDTTTGGGSHPPVGHDLSKSLQKQAWAGIDEGQKGGDTSLKQMQVILHEQVRTQTEMALMKATADAASGVAKEMKNIGRGIKDMAGN